MSRDNIVRDKSYAFAIRIVNAYKFLGQTHREFVLSKQLLRCGTSIGALIREAEHAQSEADFLNKMNIALKEANETLYWISLLKDTGYLDEAIVLPGLIYICLKLIPKEVKDECGEKAKETFINGRPKSYIAGTLIIIIWICIIYFIIMKLL